MAFDNSYRQNAVVGAVANPAMPHATPADEAFARGANQMLHDAAELARIVVPSHQSGIALVVDGDWSTVRKYFSLSTKYADWADYATPATGYGTHSWMLSQPGIVRYTQAELEAHPHWKNFGSEAGKHPPMRGWMAGPIRDRTGRSWGLLQLSDRVVGDYSPDDEATFAVFLNLVSSSLQALWDVRNVTLIST